MSGVLKFLKLDERARLPTRGSPHAAGLDLYAIEQVEIGAGSWCAVRTGLAVAIPRGFYGRVAPRSGLAVEYGLDALAGVVDSDYRGELRCVLINQGHATLTIEPGQRIAQLVIEAIITPQPEWAASLDETERGAGGFGSTGTGGDT